jgi:uncharacterized protein YndB with AHSA1/START domain
MEAKDGSMGFDFGGTYQKIVPLKNINYIIDDGREVQITFEQDHGVTHIVETFAAESQHSIDMQRQGWQNILDNFKAYTEENAK